MGISPWMNCTSWKTLWSLFHLCPQASDRPFREWVLNKHSLDVRMTQLPPETENSYTTYHWRSGPSLVSELIFPQKIFQTPLSAQSCKPDWTLLFSLPNTQFPVALTQKAASSHYPWPNPVSTNFPLNEYSQDTGPVQVQDGAQRLWVTCQEFLSNIHGLSEH